MTPVNRPPDEVHESSRAGTSPGAPGSSPHDPVLDGLLRSATRLLRCPIAVLWVPGDGRLWFNAPAGIAAGRLAQVGALLEPLLGDGFLEVPDALVDPRFADLALGLEAPTLRYWAAMPVMDDERRSGLLCLIDLVPRVFEPWQQESLADLARTVSLWLAAQQAQADWRAEAQQTTRFRRLLRGLTAEVPGMLFRYLAPAQGDGGFDFVSGGARALLELEPSLLVHDACAFIQRVHPDDRASLKRSFDDATACLAVWRHEYRVVLSHQGERWQLIHARPRRRADGSILWHGLITDNTIAHMNELQSRELRHRGQLAIEAAQLGLISIDTHARSVQLDARACELYGLPASRNRLALADWLSLFDIDDACREAMAAQIDDMASEQTLALTCGIRSADPRVPMRRLELMAQATAASDSAVGRVVGTCRDVTAQYQSAQLRREKLAAEQANREKSAFLSRVSHELRTPLNAILGFSHLLQASTEDPLNAHQREQVRHIHDAGRLLLGLIDDLLDLDRIAQGGRDLESQAVDAQALVQACLPMISRMAGEAGVTIDVVAPEQPVIMQADEAALKQVMLNLLTNGIKYNRRGGRLVVQLAAADGTARITVRDEGAGLSEAQLDQLFQPFNRLGAERLHIEGSGLGLVIARSLIIALGGRLVVDSRREHGTTVLVTLPLCARQDLSGQAVPADPVPQNLKRSAREATLLYIEDEPVNALLVQEALRSHPEWKLVVAPDGPTGLALARSLRPSIVLTDINLPGMSGLDVVRTLRAEATGSRPVCVAVSADALGEQIAEAMSAGLDEYWTKPLELDLLPGRIEGLLAVADSRASSELAEEAV